MRKQQSKKKEVSDILSDSSTVNSAAVPTVTPSRVTKGFQFQSMQGCIRRLGSRK